MRTLSKVLLWGVLAAVVMAPPVAWAQNESAVLRSQIEILRTEFGSLHTQFQDLQRHVYTGDGESPAAAGASSSPAGDNIARRLAVFESRLDQIEQNKFRQIEGQFDELRNLINRMDARLEKLVADVDFRLTAVETAPRTVAAGSGAASDVVNADDGGLTRTGGASAQGEAGQGYKPSGAPRILGTIPLDDGELQPLQPEQSQQTARATVLPKGSAEERYKYAFGLLRKAQYDEADRVLGAFIEVHSDHPLAENASYWRGETFYARKMFGDAARIYATNLQRYPQGAKAPDNMVKFGMALANLERTKEACQAFAELERKFPEMPANVRQAADRGRNAARCP